MGCFCARVVFARVSLRGVSYSNVARYFSASIADLHPDAAAQMAWRYMGSATSPAANTPGMLVSGRYGSVMM